jgi:hypothetical protein
MRKVNGGRRLGDAALLIRYCKYNCHTNTIELLLILA